MSDATSVPDPQMQDLTPARADSMGWRALLRRPLAGVAIGIGCLLAAQLLVPRGGESAEWLDPESRARDGAAALLALASIHRQVDIAFQPQSDTSTALLLVDRLTGEQSAELATWVSRGGVLVVLDPGSPLAAPRADSVGAIGLAGPIRVDAACEPISDGVLDRSVGASRWAVLATDEVLASCFPLQDGAGLVVRRHGRGRILTFGAPEAVTNRSIGLPGHASLAAALVTHGPPGGLLVVDRGVPGTGRASLWDLVPRRVWQALGLAAGAVVLAMVAVGRRHGLPVREPVPVEARGAELTASVAGLLARTHDRTHAAGLLRDAARRSVRQRIPGVLVGGTDPADMAVIADTVGLSQAEVVAALLDAPVATDEELVSVARAAAALQRRLSPGGVRAGRRPPPPGQPGRS